MVFGIGDKKNKDGKDEESKSQQHDSEGEDQNPDNKSPEESADTAKKDSEVCVMKRGDYMIHVCISQCKNMNVGEAKVDPMIQVTCLGQKKHTSALEDLGNMDVADWDEHLFFEPKNQEIDDLEKGKIEIRLLNKGFLKDTLIGFYEFDLTYLYQQPEHALLHKWVILTNPESENYGETTGQLKLSITICGDGDKQVPIGDDPNPEKEQIIQPPQIKPTFYQLYIKFFLAQKITACDSNFIGQKRSSSVMLVYTYKTTTLKTTPVKIEEGSEGWINEQFLVPAQLPLLGGRIVISVYDHNVGISDELIGSMHLEMKDLLPDAKGKRGRLQDLWDWKQIYGAPEGVSGKETKRMNLNPEIASFWKGRILIHTYCKETEKPKLMVKKLDEKEQEESKKYTTNHTYAARVYVSQAIQVPKPDTLYTVEISIGDKRWETKLATQPKPQKGDKGSRYNVFNQVLNSDEGPFQLPYLSIQDIGTLFVYLKKGKKRVCFWKGSITQFSDPNPKLHWINLEADKAVGEVKDHWNAGIVGVKISIHNVTDNGQINWDDYKFWKKPPGRRFKVANIRVFCWQARDLPAADESGNSDPYLMISDTDRVQTTQIVYDSVNPMFFECIHLYCEAMTEDEIPPIIIDAFDHDDPSTFSAAKADYLARATIDVSQCKLENKGYGNGDDIPRPAWFPCYYKKGGPVSGQLLLSFSVSIGDFEYKIRNEKEVARLMTDSVKVEEFQVKMNILGMRSLMSAGLMPVKKAFILFNIKSMIPPQLGDSLHNIKTEPKMAGPNPTLNTLLEFNVPLPRDQLFCPRLTCTVYDSIVMGLNQPILGNFVIDLGQLMQDLEKERTDETDDLRRVVEAINSLVAGESLAASMKQKVMQAQLEMAKQNDQDLVQQQNNQAKLVKFNDDEKVPLLGADADEEARQSERVAEAQRAAIEGANQRLDNNQIEEIKQNVAPQDDNLRNTMNQIEEINRINNNMNNLPDARTVSNARTGSGGFIKTHNEFDPVANKALLAQDKENKQRRRRQTEIERQKAENGYGKFQNIVWPRYEEDKKMQIYREDPKVIPPPQLFMGLGWDKDQDEKKKHYRRFYQDQLEHVTDLIPKPSPFNSYNIKRGQTRGAKASAWQKITGNFATDQSGAVNTEKRVGKFKAVIEVEAKDKRAQYLQTKQELFDELVKGLKQLAKNRKIANFDLDLKQVETQEGRAEMRAQLEQLQVNHLQIVRKLAAIQSDSILESMLLNPQPCVVRVYAIEGFDFASRDIGGESDPYLILTVGKKKYNDRENYQIDQPNPTFYKYWDFESTFPGCPELRIDAMDHDMLFGDDLIGTNYLDLEDRYFTPEWRSIKNKPIEFRELHHPTSSVAQGTIKMWVEINPNKVAPEQKARIFDITPKPPQKLVVRVCIFRTRNIKMCDFEGTSDVFFRCFFDAKKGALETDTHYRCQTGTASFNYRLNFHIEHPRKHYRLTVQAYDRDFFKSNDIIGSNFIDLTQAIQDAELTKRPLHVSKDYYMGYMKKPDEKALEFENGEYEQTEGFWLPMRSKEKDEKKGTEEVKDNGHVMMRIDITTEEFYNKNKIGSARDEPNMEPHLMPPVGRLHFTLNPFEMYKQLIGPAMRAKIAKYCFMFICTVLCALILYYLVPIVIGGLITNWISSGF